MQNKRGNVAVIALIIVFVAITVSVITWIVATKTQAPAQQAIVTQPAPVASTHSTGRSKAPINKSANQAWINSNIDNNARSGIDMATFQIIDDVYARDKNNVYIASYIDGYDSIKLDPQSFEILNGCYVRDKSQVACVYMSGGANAIHKLSQANSQNFQALGVNFGKDGINVYYHENSIKGVDLATFHFIGGDFGKDKNYVYYSDKKIAGADPATFKSNVTITEIERSNFGKAHDNINSYSCSDNVVCGVGCIITDLRTNAIQTDYFGVKPSEPGC